MDPEYVWGTLGAILQYSLDKTNMDNLEKPEYVEKEFKKFLQNMLNSKLTKTGA